MRAKPPQRRMIGGRASMSMASQISRFPSPSDSAIPLPDVFLFVSRRVTAMQYSGLLWTASVPSPGCSEYLASTVLIDSMMRFDIWSFAYRL